MRLNRYLALCGLGSRRACEEIILAGGVRINGRATRIHETSRFTRLAGIWVYVDGDVE